MDNPYCSCKLTNPRGVPAGRSGSRPASRCRPSAWLQTQLHAALPHGEAPLPELLPAYLWLTVGGRRRPRTRSPLTTWCCSTCGLSTPSAIRARAWSLCSRCSPRDAGSRPRPRTRRPARATRRGTWSTGYGSASAQGQGRAVAGARRCGTLSTPSSGRRVPSKSHCPRPGWSDALQSHRT